MYMFCMNEITTMNATLEQDMEAYSQAGFPAIELALWKVDDYLLDHSVEDLKRRLQQLKLKPVSACSKNALYLAFGDPESRNDSLRKIESDFKLMHQLECTGAYILGCNAPAEMKADTYEEFCGHLTTLGNVAQPFGVKVALEFNYCKPINSIKTVARVIRQTNHSNIGFVFDTCHFHKSPSKMEDISLLKAEEIFLVHVTDLEDVPVEVMTDMNRVIPGDGIVRIGEMMDQIIGLGYSGYYSVEIFNKSLWNEPAAAVSAKVYQSMDRLFNASR